MFSYTWFYQPSVGLVRLYVFNRTRDYCISQNKIKNKTSPLFRTAFYDNNIIMATPFTPQWRHMTVSPIPRLLDQHQMKLQNSALLVLCEWMDSAHNVRGWIPLTKSQWYVKCRCNEHNPIHIYTYMIIYVFSDPHSAVMIRAPHYETTFYLLLVNVYFYSVVGCEA